MPFGGECLPKDTNGFIGLAHDLGVSVHLAEAVITVNEDLERIVDDELVAELNGERSPKGSNDTVPAIDLTSG